MQNSKFVGVCLLLSSLILSAAIVDHAKAATADGAIGCYQFHPSNPPGVIWVMDTTTGQIKARAAHAVTGRA